MIGKNAARSRGNPPIANMIPSKATIKASWDRMKIALKRPVTCMIVASRMSRGPVHDGRPMLARRASRRVQSSHAATIGIKKPWLYSSCVVQRPTNSKSDSAECDTASSSAAMTPSIHDRFALVFGNVTDCTDINYALIELKRKLVSESRTFTTGEYKATGNFRLALQRLGGFLSIRPSPVNVRLQRGFRWN